MIWITDLRIVAATSPEVRQCPLAGRYLVSESNTARASQQLLEEQVTCDEHNQALLVGCGPGHTMEFHSQCSSEPVSGQYLTTMYWLLNIYRVLILYGPPLVYSPRKLSILE